MWLTSGSASRLGGRRRGTGGRHPREGAGMQAAPQAVNCCAWGRIGCRPTASRRRRRRCRPHTRKPAAATACPPPSHLRHLQPPTTQWPRWRPTHPPSHPPAYTARWPRPPAAAAAAPHPPTPAPACGAGGRAREGRRAGRRRQQGRDTQSHSDVIRSWRHAHQAQAAGHASWEASQHARTIHLQHLASPRRPPTPPHSTQTAHRRSFCWCFSGKAVGNLPATMPGACGGEGRGSRWTGGLIKCRINRGSNKKSRLYRGLTKHGHAQGQGRGLAPPWHAGIDCQGSSKEAPAAPATCSARCTAPRRLALRANMGLAMAPSFTTSIRSSCRSPQRCASCSPAGARGQQQRGGRAGGVGGAHAVGTESSETGVRQAGAGREVVRRPRGEGARCFRVPGPASPRPPAVVLEAELFRLYRQLPLTFRVAGHHGAHDHVDHQLHVGSRPRLACTRRRKKLEQAGIAWRSIQLACYRQHCRKH